METEEEKAYDVGTGSLERIYILKDYPFSLVEL